MNFLKQEQDIVKFVTDNYQAPEVAPHFIDEAPMDLDKYKYDNSFFFDFDSFNFESLSNMSSVNTITMHIHIVCRKGSPSKLKERMLDYASSLYDFIQENPSFGGAVDMSTVDTIDFYDNVSGDNSIKIASLNITLKVEEM
jgi:hypothetical protein